MATHLTNFLQPGNPKKWEPHFEIWKNLKDAERKAIIGVQESTNELRADIDADILNMAGKATRYGGPGSRVTNDIRENAERWHLDANKKEADRISSLVAGYRVEREREVHHLAEQNRQVEGLRRRHMDENRMAMRH